MSTVARAAANAGIVHGWRRADAFNVVVSDWGGVAERPRAAARLGSKRKSWRGQAGERQRQAVTRSGRRSSAMYDNRRQHVAGILVGRDVERITIGSAAQ